MNPLSVLGPERLGKLPPVLIRALEQMSSGGGDDTRPPLDVIAEINALADAMERVKFPRGLHLSQAEQDARRKAYAERFEAIRKQAARRDDAAVKEIVALLKDFGAKVNAEIKAAERVGDAEAAAILRRLQESAARDAALLADQLRARLHAQMDRAAVDGVRQQTEPARILGLPAEIGQGAVSVVVSDLRQAQVHSAHLVDNARGGLAADVQKSLDEIIRDTAAGSLSFGDAQEAVTELLHETTPNRAEVILRTELRRVYESASLTTAQELEKTFPEARRRWRPSPLNEQSRPLHRTASLLNQRPTAQGEFVLDDGTRLAFPGDPMAPPEQTINCKCIVTEDISREAYKAAIKRHLEKLLPRAAA